ncbi:ROK family protein [Clostridium sp. LY3-2]|uniref:ROK family protein n=1 Tax=Clostridium sp. LY3-2 TaxID=2942482 RepID=UPI0021525C2D|nr:ROK family protein [Clostridium sp. LY3-2]MCR6514794.1 ROK family protein [Clostridium sp. LY3-2]
MEKLFIGIDLGGTKIYSALADKSGEILKEIVVKTEAFKGADSIVGKIKDSISYLLEDIDKERVVAIGIGSPGPLDVKNGLIAEPANLPFKNYNIVKELEDAFKISVYLDNDANVATLAEHRFGAGINTENMVYVTVSTGIGGGAILNGKIYRGSTSNALEVGHTTVSTRGRRCGCGNRGCVESLSSGTAISNLANEALKSRVKTSLREYDEVTAKVFKEAKNGDRLSKEILKESLSYLGVAVSNYANIFDPDMIVIGGGISNEWDILSESIKEEMEKRCLSTILNNCKIVKAKLDGKSGVLGAIALAITKMD